MEDAAGSTTGVGGASRLAEVWGDGAGSTIGVGDAGGSAIVW